MTLPTVLHVIHNLEREGAQMVVRHLTEQLVERGARQLVFAWHHLGPMAQDFRQRGVVVHGPLEGATGRVFAAQARLRRLAREARVDVIHAHMSDSAILAAAAGLLGALPPVIATHHSTRLIPSMARHRTWLRGQLFRWAIRRAAANVAVTPQVAERLRSQAGLDRTDVEVNTNGIPLSTAKRATKDVAAIRPILVSVGRLIPSKRHDLVIRAMPLIRKQLPEARLIIVGGGPERSNLERLAAANDLAQAVTFTGLVADVGAILALADVFVSASAYEGLPVSLLEAFASGLPVVASAVPGHDQIVSPGVTGLLFPADDGRSLAEAVVRIVADADLRQRTVAAARRLVERRYGQTRMVEAYLDLYARLTGACRRGCATSGLH